jgi:hypothetical protein
MHTIKFQSLIGCLQYLSLFTNYFAFILAFLFCLSLAYATVDTKSCSGYCYKILCLAASLWGEFFLMQTVFFHRLSSCKRWNFTLPGFCWIDFLRKSSNGLVNGDTCISLITLMVLPTGIVAFKRNVGGTDECFGKSMVEMMKLFEDSTPSIFWIAKFINLTTITNEV